MDFTSIQKLSRWNCAAIFSSSLFFAVNLLAQGLIHANNRPQNCAKSKPASSTLINNCRNWLSVMIATQFSLFREKYPHFCEDFVPTNKLHDKWLIGFYSYNVRVLENICQGVLDKKILLNYYLLFLDQTSLYLLKLS